MLKATDPSNGKVIREVQTLEADQVERLLSTGQQAFQEWRQTTFAERASVLRDVARLMHEDIDRLAMLMTEEMGKPVKEAHGEVKKAAWCAEHYADHAEQYLATETITSDASHSYVRYEPLGVILGILPWNAPFWLAFRYGAPTLMAGNTCIMKHDPHVPGCAEAIAELFERVNAPAGIFQNLPLQTPEVEAVIRDERIRAVSFTGSERGGAAVSSIAASEIKHSVLELGGSDPAIVLADADLEQAADTLVLSRIINAGQSCIAAKRLIIEAPVYDKMLDMLKERFARLKLGDPREESTDVGPMARDDLRAELHKLVTDSIKAGARCLLGGEIPDGPGNYYPVTLLADVTTDMPVACEETFGPVGVVMKARDADDALLLANNSRYGLGAAVWTADAQRGEAMAKQLEAGQVSVNGIVKTDPRLPSGGIKRSGFGRELGPHGIREFVNAKQIWVGPKQGD